MRSRTLQIVTPAPLADLVEQAARSRVQKAPEYIRQSMVAALQRDGFDPVGAMESATERDRALREKYEIRR